ncbi:hypothetical protein BKI52_37085 [marine bacterium AO1-C]|nr:hypothetical protein BKI52_37085 [marine bacterium AO1-C]
MRKLVLALALCMPFIGFAQKVKFIKNPATWTYKIAPKKALDKSWKKNKAIVETTLDPMTYEQQNEWNRKNGSKGIEKKKELYAKASQDIVDKWARKYLLITQYPFRQDKQAPDFTIKLTANEFKIENTQLDIDFSDKQSVLCEVNATARLTVTDKNDQVLLDEQIRYLIDDKDGPTNKVKLNLFLLDPVFKLKFKLTRKPEKRKRMLQRKLNRYQADVLEYFMIEGETMIKSYFLNQRQEAVSAILGIKGKKYKEFSELSKSISKSINKLSSLSKKRRKTLTDIKPELEAGIQRWKAELEKANHPKVKQVMHHNLAVALLILGDVAKAREYLEKIPDYDVVNKKMIMSGSYRAYLKGLVDAIKVKEKYLERATLYQF